MRSSKPCQNTSSSLVSQCWFPSQTNISSLEHNPAGKCFASTAHCEDGGISWQQAVVPLIPGSHQGMGPVWSQPLQKMSDSVWRMAYSAWFNFESLLCKFILVTRQKYIIFAVLEDLLCLPTHTHTHTEKKCLSDLRQSEGWKGKSVNLSNSLANCWDEELRFVPMHSFSSLFKTPTFIFSLPARLCHCSFWDCCEQQWYLLWFLMSLAIS